MRPGRSLGPRRTLGRERLLGAIFLIAATIPLARFALQFGPWEYFSLFVFALSMVAGLMEASLLKGFLSAAIGLIITVIGADPIMAVPRFTFGSDFLQSGFQFLPVLIGVFAFAQIMSDVEKMGGERRDAVAGFRTVVAQPGARVIVALYSVESLAVGIFGVAMIAAVIDLLELGQSGVGFASAVMSVGGLAGAFVGLALGGRRLAVALGAGVLVWGGAVALVGAWPEPAFALVLLGVAGLGDTVADASGITILQRTIPEDVLSRAFGALAMILWGAAALGALLAPVLVELLGIRGTLVAAGAPVALLALAAWGSLRRIDAATAPSPALELLRAVPLFAPLPLSALERLAAGASPVVARAGTEVVTEGQAGDRFYVVESGEVDVSVDGRGVATLGRGEHFGEIALLRDVPRTATVTARGDAALYALDREEFVGVVTGDAASLEAANAVIGSRLTRGIESAAGR